MKKNKLFFAAALAALLIFSGCGQTAASSAQSKASAASSSESAAVSSDSASQSIIDFDEVQKENNEIYAWIRIPDTNVDYPILQSMQSDEYYLRKDIHGEYDLGGSLFTQVTYNRQTFDDPNTVIYGHNMAGYGDTMFTDVRKYEDREFFDSHRDIYIYTPEKQLHYKVFAAYTWSDEHLLYNYQCWIPEVFQNYLDTVFENKDLSAIIDDTMTVTAEDKIITLSTCEASTASPYRYLVQAVLQ